MEKKQPLYLTANEHHGERERYWPRQLTADTWPWAEPSLSNMFKWVSGLAFRNTHARRRCSPIKSGENPMWVWFNLGSPKPHPRLKFLQGPCRKQCLTPLCASPECLTEVWEKTNNSPSSGRGKKKKKQHPELAIQAGKGTGVPVCKIIPMQDSLPPPPTHPCPEGFRNILLMLVNLPIFLNVRFKYISKGPCLVTPGHWMLWWW